jgi:hypothetical protein
MKILQFLREEGFHWYRRWGIPIPLVINVLLWIALILTNSPNTEIKLARILVDCTPTIIGIILGLVLACTSIQLGIFSKDELRVIARTTEGFHTYDLIRTSIKWTNYALIFLFLTAISVSILWRLIDPTVDSTSSGSISTPLNRIIILTLSFVLIESLLELVFTVKASFDHADWKVLIAVQENNLTSLAGKESDDTKSQL